MNQPMPPGVPGAGGAPPKKKSNAVTIVLVVLAVLFVGGGVVAALAIAGVRRYLSSAKTSEAKNTIGAIARGQVSAYEKNGKLCGAAPAVPKAVPKGVKYQSDPRDGQDYNTGSPTAGWKCLHFDLSTPQYFQYEMRVGGGYVGTSRGLADPGPDGFEVSAVGDLDGDGETSLFLLTGKVDKAAKKVVLGPISIFDESE
jgi:hypothetical protein